MIRVYHYLYSKQYVSANKCVFIFSHALNSESVRTGETYSTENPSQNYKCCSQDCSTILPSDEYILQQVLFAQLWPLFLSFTLCYGKQD